MISALEVLEGGIDIHAHTGPCVFNRINDSFEAAEEGRSFGMRAIVLKNHHGITSDRATLVQRKVPGIEVYGGVVLNLSTGGINPVAVENALMLGRCKMVWLPTQTAQHNINVYGSPHGYFHMSHVARTTHDLKMKGIRILTPEGQVTEETREVISMVKEAHIGIGAGHVTKEEIVAFVKECKKMGLKRGRCVVNHVDLHELWTWSIAEQRELVELGAFVEHTAIHIQPNRLLITAEKLAEQIKALGAGNIIISSDCGQLKNPTPAQGMRIIVEKMLDCGITAEELRLMIRDNPATLLAI
jgi:hypothetical protein